MLKSSQLDNALALHRNSGSRCHGHYDHDANNAAGPQLTSGWASESEKTNNTATGKKIEFRIDPKSGELLVK